MFEMAVKAMDGFDPRPLSRPELADALAGYDRVIAKAEAGRMAVLAAVEALDDRGADAASMGRSVSRRSERRAKADAKTAEALAEMPDVAAKLEQGQITTEHAAACADAASRLSPDTANGLASMAASMPADRFAKQAREWVNKRESALAKETRFRRQRRRRKADTWTSGDGMVHIHAQFDPLTGQAVAAALAEQTDRLWRADGGRDGTPDDVRTPAQRRADALAELAGPAGDADSAVEVAAPAADAPHPRWMVHVIYNLADGTLQLADGEPLPLDVLAEIGPQAEVVGHVFDGRGRPLWLGRSKRLADRAQWISLIARDRGCDDCGAPVHITQAHHADPWHASHGETNIDRLELKCPTCHANEHRGNSPPERRHGAAA